MVVVGGGSGRSHTLPRGVNECNTEIVLNFLLVSHCFHDVNVIVVRGDELCRLTMIGSHNSEGSMYMENLCLRAMSLKVGMVRGLLVS